MRLPEVETPAVEAILPEVEVPKFARSGSAAGGGDLPEIETGSAAT